MGDHPKRRPHNPFAVPTRERWRTALPHWEVEGRAHFVTIRCAGALPREACERLRELNDSLQRIEPRSRDFALLQRQYFLTAEKYLDTAGTADDPFKLRAACEVLESCLERLPSDHGWEAINWVIMPNHIHALLRSRRENADSLRLMLTRLKGRSARTVNQVLGRRGELWQSEWFDRWARTEAEEARIAEYICQNPVKARLVSDWKDYPWVR